jgi:ribosome biogenesis protein BRX1
MLKRKTESGEKKKKIRREAEESVAPLEIAAPTSASRPVYTNRQRILLIASRGINARYRHLLEDLKKLLPHHKKDNKLDAKNNIQAINEIAEMNSCNQVLYLECRKKQDLYLHLARTPNGPSVKFHVVNIHTMDELKLTGNAMIGSRPLLNFDKNFDGSPQMMLIKSLLSEAFGTPNGHPKSKPFVDRVMCFYLLKNKICESSTLCGPRPHLSVSLFVSVSLSPPPPLSLGIRNYQILDRSDRHDGKDTHLVEIGPRMVLIPIRIFNGSFGGATLYQNQAFVSPNEERSEVNKRKGFVLSHFCLSVSPCPHSLSPSSQQSLQ